MPTNRRTGRQRPGDGPPPGRPGGRPDGRKKLTAWVPADLLRRLRHLSIDEGMDLGALIAPPLWSLVGQRYQVHRRPGPADAPPADPDAGPETLRLPGADELPAAG